MRDGLRYQRLLVTPDSLGRGEEYRSVFRSSFSLIALRRAVGETLGCDAYGRCYEIIHYKYCSERTRW